MDPPAKPKTSTVRKINPEEEVDLLLKPNVEVGKVVYEKTIDPRSHKWTLVSPHDAKAVSFTEENEGLRIGQHQYAPRFSLSYPLADVLRDNGFANSDGLINLFIDMESKNRTHVGSPHIRVRLKENPSTSVFAKYNHEDGQLETLNLYWKHLSGATPVLFVESSGPTNYVNVSNLRISILPIKLPLK
jgi:hypothetical protein